MLWIEHLGIVVRDLSESVEFYARLFQRDPVEHLAWRDENAAYVADLLGVPAAGFEADAAFFEIPYSTSLLELLTFRGIPGSDATVRPTRAVDVGASHFGFYVDSIAETLERCGLADDISPTSIPFGPYKGGKSAYLHDPNGVLLQLMEVVGRPGNLPVLRRSGAHP